MFPLSGYLIKKLFALLLWMGFLGIMIVPVKAEESANQKFHLFEKGQFAVQAAFGTFTGPIFVKKERPKFHFYQTNLRIGLMLNDPVDTRFFFDGNFEGLLEITYSGVNGEIDGFFAGGAILVRYNVLSIQSKRVVPYLQAGAGIVRNNIYKDETQRMIGSRTEFTLRAGLGVRFLILESWSLDLESALEHISDAGRSNRNRGMNACGFLVGFTHFF